jgi:WD40 repeat protein
VVSSVAFSPDGRKVLSGSRDNTLKLWDAASGGLLRTFAGHSHEVLSVAFSPDGRQVLSGSRDNTLKLWGAASGALIHTFEGHSDVVSSVAFSPDGRKFCRAAGTGQVEFGMR